MTEYEECGQMIKKHLPLCEKAFSSLPLKNRRAAWAVLALFYQAEQLSDLTELSLFEQAADAFLTGTSPGGFLWEALGDARRQFTLEEEPFCEFIAGQRQDREKGTYDELDELLMYAYQTGGAIGLLILPICARRNQDKLRNAAVSLGVAIQLTRLLRDIETDERQKKRLPRQVMGQFGYTEEELGSHTVNKAFINVWEYIAFEAEAYYEEAAEAMPLFPKYSQSAVNELASCYQTQLKEIRNRLSQA